MAEEEVSRSGFWGNPGWLAALIAACSVGGSFAANLADRVFAYGGREQQVQELKRLTDAISARCESNTEHLQSYSREMLQRLGHIEGRLSVLEDRTGR
jgi:hypothetical protein